MNTWTAAEQATIDAASAWVNAEVRPHAAAWAVDGGDPRAVLQGAARHGLLGIEVPVAHGGLGLRFACKARVAELLAAADFGLAMALVNTHNVARHLAEHAAPEVARRAVADLLAGRRTGCTALTEPSAGSDFAAIQTLAQPVGDGWQIDGEKAWIVNATHADVVVLYAQTQPGGGARGIGAFVIDSQRAGFVRHGPAGTTAARCIHAGSFGLQAYRAEANELLHPPGQAFKAALISINGARTYVAAMCCGMVAECLRVASAYGARRHAFGLPLHGHQGWRWSLADAQVDLQAAQGLVAAASAHLDAGADAQAPAAAAKVFATRMAARHLGALLHAMGAEGLREEHPFMRHLAAAQVASLVDGSTEMLLERIARTLPAAHTRPEGP
jgi:alkylation response protein AidB-like acyl-CoA dehydrogenase